MAADQRSFAITAAVALILRTIDADLYHRFHCGEASDLDVVDKMFASPGAITFKDEDVGALLRERSSSLLMRCQGAAQRSTRRCCSGTGNWPRSKIRVECHTTRIESTGRKSSNGLMDTVVQLDSVIQFSGLSCYPLVSLANAQERWRSDGD